jgi:hypothetical protein
MSTKAGTVRFRLEIWGALQLSAVFHVLHAQLQVEIASSLVIRMVNRANI